MKKVISEPVRKLAKEDKLQKREALGTVDMNPRIASVAEKLIQYSILSQDLCSSPMFTVSSLPVETVTRT